MSLVTPETYIPKCNKSWNRLPVPWTLKTLALRTILHSLSRVKHPVREVNEVNLRQYLTTNILPEFFDEIIRLAHYNMLKPDSLVNVLHALPPSAYATCIDLLGFYEGTECCKPDSSTNWIFGYLPDICLDSVGLTKLVNLMLKLDLSRVHTIRFWAKEGAIKESRFPHILSKAVNLTSLTIRGDANDHFLRVLGSNCNSLRWLDIERSNKVTGLGLINMIVQKAIKGPTIPFNTILSRVRRPIATSLQSLVLTIGNTYIESLETVASLLTSYLATCLPEAKLVKLGTTMGQGISMRSAAGHNLVHNFGTRATSILDPLEYNIFWSPAIEVIASLQVKFENWITRDIWTSIREIMTFTLLPVGDCQLDVYCNRQDGSLFIYAHKIGGRFLHVFYKVSPEKGLTHLTFFWDTFHWDVAQVCQLSDIVAHAPNLENLQGRITGIWSGPRLILPYLTRVHCWILDDATIISILQMCSSLEYLDIKNVRAIENDPDDPPSPILNHQTLLALFQLNPYMWPNLIEFLVRPTNLTYDSALSMIKLCPKLMRLGDLECWDVTTDQIRDLNRKLFHSGSQCTLVVLSFPPQRKF